MVRVPRDDENVETFTSQRFKDEDRLDAPEEPTTGVGDGEVPSPGDGGEPEETRGKPTGNLYAAIMYLEQGLSVIPGDPHSKKPALTTWKEYQKRLPTREEVTRWFTETNYLVGFVTGDVSKIDVVDVDPRHGGDAALAEVIKQHGPIAVGPEALTGGGGLHLYYRHKMGRKNVGGEKGIDIRADRGFIVAPPSIHPTTGLPYTWAPGHEMGKVPLCEMPEALEQAAQEKTAPHVAQPTTKWEEALGKVPQGSQDEHLISLAGKLIALNRSIPEPLQREMVLSALRKQASSWPQDAGDPWTDADFERHYESALKKDVANHGGEQPGKLTGRTWDDMHDSPLPPVSYTVRGMFREREINAIVAAPMTGKSTVAEDIGLSLAVSSPSVPALGQFPIEPLKNKTGVVIPRKVLYLFGEQGRESWEQRLLEIGEFRGVTQRGVPIRFIPAYDWKMDDPKKWQQLLECIMDEAATDVFIDPLVALSNCPDENDAAEVREHIREPLQRLIAATNTDARSTTLYVIHHSALAVKWHEPSSATDLVRGSGDFQAMVGGGILGLWWSHKEQVLKALAGGRMTPHNFRLQRHQAPAITKMAGQLGDPRDRACEPLLYDGEWESESKQDVETAVILKASQVDRPLSNEELAEMTGHSKSRVTEITKKLADAGQADLATQTGKGKTRFFRLKKG